MFADASVFFVCVCPGSWPHTHTHTHTHPLITSHSVHTERLESAINRIHPPTASSVYLVHRKYLNIKTSAARSLSVPVEDNWRRFSTFRGSQTNKDGNVILNHFYR